MELKPGYKQTEVGVIPEDWEVHSFGTIGQTLIGLTYSPRDVSDSGTLVLRSSNIQQGRLTFEDNVFVRMDVPERAITREGDLLICVRNGSRALIGKSAIIDKRTAGSAFGAFMSVFRSGCNRYLAFAFDAEGIKRQVNEILGATINQITNRDLNGFLVALPPTLAEQEAIAAALSDADALIDSLEQLIAKKRLLKQGAMQDLLTGKKRLPGFEGEWEVKAIREILAVLMDFRGRTPKKLGMEWGGGDIRALSAGNVRMGHVDFSQECYFGSDALYRKWMVHGETRKDDILVTTEAPLGNVALIPDSEKYILSQRTILLRPYDDVAHSHFLFHTLSSPAFQALLLKDSSGSTATGIQRLKFEKIPVSLPSLPEQTAIAAILSDMDAEIAALEAKLAKARKVKQGMMQELLTGKTRLI